MKHYLLIDQKEGNYNIRDIDVAYVSDHTIFSAVNSHFGQDVPFGPTYPSVIPISVIKKGPYVNINDGSVSFPVLYEVLNHTLMESYNSIGCWTHEDKAQKYFDRYNSTHWNVYDRGFSLSSLNENSFRTIQKHAMK